MRLTGDIKKGIVNRVVAETFAARKEALNAEYADLGEAAYAFLCCGNEDIMNKLPEGFFRELDIVYCRFAGCSGYEIRLPLQEIRRLPYSGAKEIHSFPADHPLTARYQAYLLKQDKLNDDITRVKETVRSLLVGVNTAKQLTERWPEGVKYLPTLSITTLPAIIAEDVNKLIEGMR